MCRLLLVFVCITAFAQTPLGYTGNPSTKQNSISVTDPKFNGGDTAVCSGASHDDRGAFQTTLDYASTNAIPFVTMPAVTCYMGSYVWDGLLTVNLQMPNGVTLQGTAGSSKILETAAGRPVCNTLCTIAVINIGTFIVSWPRMGCPGVPGLCTGYMPLHATTAGAKTATLSNATQGAQFHAGDYITLYDHQPRHEDDVISGFQSTVTNIAGGTLTFADAMPRTYSAPYIGNISTGPAQLAHDIGIEGVIVEGACALVMTETFNLTLRNDHFITDTDLYDATHQYIAVGQWNSLKHFTFDSNQFVTIGANGTWWAAEWPQRNSGFGTWINNTVGAIGGFNSWGGSEFGHDIVLTGNHIYTNPSGVETCGFNLGGQNVLISNNDFHTSGSWSAPGGGFICDILAPNADYPEYGNIVYYGNAINCNARGGVCVALQALQGLTFSGNTITVPAGSDSLYAILLQYNPSNAHLDHNQISVQSGYGIYVIPPVDNSWTINGNTVTAVAGAIGITVGPTSNGGGPCSVQNNTSTGFATDISGDPNVHKCTIGNNQ